MKIITLKTKFSEKFLFFFLGILLLYVYSPVFSYGLTGWDDTGIIVDNHIWGKGYFYIDTIKAIFIPGAIQGEQLYIPVTYLSFLLEKLFFNMKPQMLHFDNFLIHLANVALVYFLLKKITGSFFVSAVTSIVFALHPIQVESVAWIAGRKELLYTFFSLLCLHFWCDFLDAKKRVWPLASFLFLLLALLSKPSAIVIPGILLILFIIKLKRGNPKESSTSPGSPEMRFNAQNDDDVIETEKSDSGVYTAQFKNSGIFNNNTIAMLSMCGFVFLSVITYLVNSATSFAMPGTTAKYRLFRATYLPEIFVEWIGRFFLAKPCSAFYSWPSLTNAIPLETGTLFLTAIFIYASIIYVKNHFRTAGFLILTFFVTLIPPFMLAVYSYRDFYTADRYAYFPLLWFFAFLLYEFSEIKSCLFKLAGWIMILLFIVNITSASIRQVSHWRNAETLWNSVIKVDPACSVAYYHLGNFHMRESKYDAAEKDYIKCLRSFPDCEAAYNLAVCMEIKGNLPASEKYLRISIGIDPFYLPAYKRLGVLLMKSGRSAEAEKILKKINR